MPRSGKTEEEVTFTEAAKRLGVTKQGIADYVANWKDAPIVLMGAKRLCRWPDFPQWVRRNLQQSRQKPENIAEAEARTAMADAELKELKLQRERGEVVLIETFRQQVRRIAETLRSQLLSVPGRYAPRTAGKSSLVESQAAWDAAIRDVLAELRDRDGD